MKFSTVYRASFYLMLFFATMTLNIDAADSKIAFLFPIATAAAGFAAFLTVDRNPRLGLPRPLAYALLVLSFCLSVVEHQFEENVVLALAHFLVYLQIVKIFLRKRAEDDWLLFGLGVMQVLVGSVISQSDHVGMMLMIWALLSLWVLGLFSLSREAVRAGIDPAAGSAAAPSRDEPYPGLFESGYFFSAFRVTATTLALGGVIFMFLPRRPGSAGAQGISAPPKHMTGFDDEVELGQLGEILESDNVVMNVKLSDASDRPLSLIEESLLWRGVTMEEYRNGRWHRQKRANAPMPNRVPEHLRASNVVRQRIQLEPTDADVLFGLRPILEVKHQRAEPDLNPRDGTIFRAYARRGAYEYEVLSSRDPDLPQPGETSPLVDVRRVRRLLDLPPLLKTRLESIARDVIEREKIPPEDALGRARALERHLRDSGGYGYTLKLAVVDPSLDPVEDFLVNRKEGHCEYFASALTLMLRAVGIPARLVNGFKGGDWNDFNYVLSVRQKHAHSWVEAFLPTTPRSPPLWITLDPTPAVAREQSVAMVGGVGKNMRKFIDLIHYFWVFYVVGFNAERQNALLYEPLRRLLGVVKERFANLGDSLETAAARLFYFQNVRQFISVRGFLVSFAGLLLLVLLFRAGHWTWRRFFRWWRGGGADSAASSADVHIYRRLTLLLAEFGLERFPAETQHEFARRAAVHLVGRGPVADEAAEAPRLVVEAFYRVRFGHRDLEPTDLRLLESRLDDLESGLRAGQT